LDQLPLPVLVALVVLAIVAGLYLGYRAGNAVPRAGSRSDGKTLGARARGAATSGFVRLWKWSRARKRSAEKT
jgi:hypothetical protein